MVKKISMKTDSFSIVNVQNNWYYRQVSLVITYHQSVNYGYYPDIPFNQEIQAACRR